MDIQWLNRPFERALIVSLRERYPNDHASLSEHHQGNVDQ